MNGSRAPIETPPAPAPPSAPPPPDFGTAFSVVSERIKSFKEVGFAIIAIAGTGIGAWMYFASEAELTKARCMIDAHITVSAYQDKIDLYDLEIDHKTRIKNALAMDLDKLHDSEKLEQLNTINQLERGIATIQRTRDAAQAEYGIAQKKLDSDSCSEKTSKPATEEKK